MNDKLSGVISPAIKIEADNGGFIVTLRIDSLEFLKDESSSDEYKFMLVASLFKHTLNNFDPELLRAEDSYVCAEINKESFSKEISITCENNMGAYFEYGAVNETVDEMTRFVPKVVVRGQND
jgi:hypothetical protein